MQKYIFFLLRYFSALTIVGFLSCLCGCCVTSSRPSSYSPDYYHRTYVGIASWYGPKFHGRKTASGEKFNMYKLTAAHNFLPFGTIVRVVNLANGRSVIVRINDRGPFKKGRIIDLSYAAAKRIGIISKGTEKVKIEVIRMGKAVY